jgi:hypothetical protein
VDYAEAFCSPIALRERRFLLKGSRESEEPLEIRRENIVKEKDALFGSCVDVPRFVVAEVSYSKSFGDQTGRDARVDPALRDQELP